MGFVLNFITTIEATNPYIERDFVLPSLSFTRVMGFFRVVSRRASIVFDGVIKA